MSYLTVDGLMPNSEIIMAEIEKLGVHDDDGQVNLNGFKNIIMHFKKLVNKQLEFRERIENILKIRVEDKKEYELRSLLREFYKSMVDFIYDSDTRKHRSNTHLLVADLIIIISLSFQNSEFHQISNLIYSFDESREGVLDFDEFFSMVQGLHY